METLMRNAPSIAVLVVMIIQVSRVSDFGKTIGAGKLAPVFAVFLAGVIYVLSYWYSRTSNYEVAADAKDPKQLRAYNAQKKVAATYAKVRLQTGFWLFAFIAIEGFLNLAETLQTVPDTVSSFYYFGAVLYGGFPTLAAFGLGSLQASLDRMPVGIASKSLVQSFFDSRMKNAETQSDAQPAQTLHPENNAPHNAKDAAYPKDCPHGCGVQLKSAAEYSAHVGRWCEIIRAKNAQNSASASIPVDLEKPIMGD